MSHRNYKFDEPYDALSDLSSASVIDADDEPIRMSHRPSTPIWKATSSSFGDALTDSDHYGNSATLPDLNIRSGTSPSGIQPDNSDAPFFEDSVAETLDARIVSEKVVEPTFLTGIANFWAGFFEYLRRFLPEGLNDSSLARIHLFLCAFGLIAIALLIIIIVF